MFRGRIRCTLAPLIHNRRFRPAGCAAVEEDPMHTMLSRHVMRQPARPSALVVAGLALGIAGCDIHHGDYPLPDARIIDGYPAPDLPIGLPDSAPAPDAPIGLPDGAPVPDA